MPRPRKSAALGTTSKELDRKHPYWRNQASSSGKHTTAITKTEGTYRNIGAFLLKQRPGAAVLDASSGLGLGTLALRSMGFRVEDVEPYVSSSRREKPTYTDYNAIRKTYDVVISNAVINVIPDDWRESLIRQMGGLVRMGGILIINTRSRREIQEGGGIVLDDDGEKLISRGGGAYSYQRGFTQQGLEAYAAALLGKSFRVERATAANSGVKSGTAVVCTRL